MALRHPRSEGICNCTSLNVGSNIVGVTPRHRERGSPDVCAVARKHPQSEGGCNSTSLNVGNGEVGKIPRYEER